MADAASSPSPSNSYQEPPSLERLVANFVAAKRSLSSTSHVYRANEIVQDARVLVEEIAVLGAKNKFVRNGVDEQVHVLQSVGSCLDTVGREAQVEFNSVIKSLDFANDRLQATLASLRKTIVRHGLESSSYNLKGSEHSNVGNSFPSPRQSGINSSQKTLHDFIDESTHQSLLDALRSSIDSYNDAQGDLHTSRTAFEGSLKEVDDALHAIDKLQQSHTLSTDSPEASTTNDPIPHLLHSLTTHATETASLLQSLISHYDLCITALKHTEGGGEAARAATDHPSSPNPFQTSSSSPVEESLYRNKVREPISASERSEMLAVLENDASEVDDVVLEIGDRLQEMETQSSTLAAHASNARDTHKRLESVISLLRKIGVDLPLHIEAAKAFRIRWATLRAEIETKTEELGSLTGFYDSFVASYASLIREVERRQMVEGKMRKIVDRARRDIEALYAEDVDMRAQFVKEAGEFLPRDIWPGLVDSPVKWEIRAVGDEDQEGYEDAGDDAA